MNLRLSCNHVHDWCKRNEEIFAVPNHWMFNMGVVVAFMGALAYVVRVYARLVELGAETGGTPIEGKLYSRSIP